MARVARRGLSRRRTRALPFAAALLLCAGQASASQPDLQGLGARSAALAGAGAADAEGYDAAFLNPAGAVGPEAARLTLGYLWGTHALQLNGAARSVAPERGLQLGIAAPLPFGGVLEKRLGLAIAAYLPIKLIDHARSPFVDEPRLVLLDDRTQVVSVLACAGVRVTDQLSLGVGTQVLATLLGQIRVAPDTSGRLVTLADEEATLRAAPLFGARLALGRLHLGATVRGASAADFDLTIKADLGPSLPIAVPVMRIKGVAQYDPLQAVLEAAWDLGALRLLAGATWKRWSDFPAIGEKVTAGAPEPVPAGLVDTFTPRLAAELQQGALLLRAGYLLEPTPAKSAAPSLVDATRHVFTAGAGFGVRGLRFDLFAQLHALQGSARAQGTIFALGGTVGADL